MRSSKRRHIGVLTPYTGGFYYGAVLDGVKRQAMAMNVAVVAVQTAGTDLCWPGESEYLGLDALDGWIGVNEFECAPYTEEIVRRRIPFVCVHARPARIPCCSVLPDNVGGTRAGVAHLIDHGHRRIAFAGSLHQVDLLERREGYIAALVDAGLPVDESLLLTPNTNLELDGQELAKRLLAGRLPFTAVMTGTDKLAIGLMAELSAAGVRIPQDVALVGFDDVDEAQYASPPLTTIRQDFGEVAAMATRTLVEHLVDGVDMPTTLRVPVSFVARRSCGCTLTYSVPPLTPADTQAERQETLTFELLRAAGVSGKTRESPSAWPGASRIAAQLAALVDHPAEHVSDLGDAWSGFLASRRDAESMDRLMVLVETTLRRWCPNFQSRPDLLGAVRELRVSLLREWQRAEQRRLRNYEFAAEANGKISHALASSRLERILDLSWLGWTQVRYGCVGLWSCPTGGSPRTLAIVGEFDAEGGTGVLMDEQIRPAMFPPPRLVDLILDRDDDCVVTVVPVPGKDANHGLLAVASRIEIERLDHLGNVGDWAARVGASLERANIEQRLQHTAERDSLTGLPNRTLLLEKLDNFADRAGQLAVLSLDLDDFKKINDSLGHDFGDDLLRQVARRLERAVDTESLVARLGGDEFVVVVPDCAGESGAIDASLRIQEAMRAPFQLGSDVVFCSCSIGVALNDDAALTSGDLLRDADTAMYRAKVKGRAHQEIFQHGMHAQAVERLRLDTRLRQALERGEFVLLFQPIVSVASGQDVGAEALLRWNHPEQGLLAPGRFLAVAEEVGLAIPLSKWVFREACRNVRRWQRRGAAVRYVSVNVPAEHLQQPDFSAQIEARLAEFSLPPRALGIELVESSLVERQSATTATLATLLKMGIRVAIDDFGTGYSSLSYLRDLPVSVLKIDRSFVQNVPRNPRDTAIAHSILTLGQGLGLTVVAEGVETNEQLDFMRTIGCDYVQGYLTGRPMSAANWERRLLVGHEQSDA
ncbi:MAG: EAL domain-containing protein [Polyangiaceae bacterium]|nr:EAL domain-containing protein [Polyangiaceae bacterium]